MDVVLAPMWMAGLGKGIRGGVTCRLPWPSAMPPSPTPAGYASTTSSPCHACAPRPRRVPLLGPILRPVPAPSRRPRARPSALPRGAPYQTTYPLHRPPPAGPYHGGDHGNKCAISNSPDLTVPGPRLPRCHPVGCACPDGNAACSGATAAPVRPYPKTT